MPLVIVLLLAAPFTAFGQSNVVRSRVTDRVDISRLTTLSGNTHPLARAQYDQGAAPPDLPMNRMLLVLKRSPEQESALQDLLTQQQVTASANFRKWLTPDQFGQQFGVADADIQAVTSWLGSFGFQSIKVAKGKNVIEFSGTASQVESALHTSIHRYVVNGETHWANSGDPQIPTALAPVVAGFVSLHDFHHKPTIHRSDRKLTANVSSGLTPQINLKENGNTIHALVPGDFNTIYNIDPNTMTGGGATIGIVSNSNINVQDVRDFRSAWKLAPNDPIVVLNGPDPGDISGSPAEGEAVLDATWSGAVAPAATVDLVVSEDTNASAGADLSEFYIIDNNLADVMTESFQACELAFQQVGQLTGAGGAAQFYQGMAEEAAAQGISYLVSSGDGGPDSCDDFTTEPATTAASVNLLASTPFDTAVGGTELHDCDPLPTCSDSSGTYWKTSNLANGSSAKSYVPEIAWNESCDGKSATCDIDPVNGPILGLYSSGGGQSIAFPKPVWQAGSEIPSTIASTNARFVPDVAVTAADHDGYVLCIDQSCEGVNCPPPVGTPCYGIASGTSASVQAFGGIMALVVQNVGGRVGLANYVLYNLAGKESSLVGTGSYASCNGSSTTALVNATDGCIFNDVTVGNTNVPGETGFNAGVGYDETTGLGSVNVSNLVNKWNTAIVSGTTTTLTLNPVSSTHGSPVSVDIHVTATPPATGTPSGDVSLISDNSASDHGIDMFTLNSSGVVSALGNSTTLLPGGTYQVRAHYAGDKNFLGSDSTPTTVTVTPENSAIYFGLVVNAQTTACSATSVAYGSAYVLTVVVADQLATQNVCSPSETGSSPTGTVTLTDSFNGGGATPLDGGSFKLNSFGYFEDQPIQLAAGAHLISASYAGDNSFNKSGPATATITVTKAATTTTVTASPTSAGIGQAVTLTATVNTRSNAIASASQEPMGTVKFFVGGTAFGSPVAVTGGATSAGFAQATATISPTNLATGTDAITAQYSGDSNYSQSAISAAVNVSVGVPGIGITACSGATINVPQGSSGTCVITATGANGFSGAVTLSAAVTTMPSGAVYPPTCSFGTPASSNFAAPSTINLSSSNTSGNATMTCATTPKTGGIGRPTNRPAGPGWPLAGTAIALACVFFLLMVPRQRQWGMVSLVVLLAAIAVVSVSCGSYNSGNGGGNPGTTKGAYTVTVTATPPTGTAAQTTTVTVNVQ